MDVLRVAPREISDVVTRCCRVRGMDPGVAQQIGLDVLAAHLRDGQAFTSFAHAARTTDLTTFAIAANAAETPADPYRDGVEVDAASWRELYEMSAAFLVSAELLDSFVDEDS